MANLSEKDFERFVLFQRPTGGPKSPINVFEIGMAGKQIRIRHGTKGKKLGKSILKKASVIEARNAFNDKRRQKIAEGYQVVKERAEPRIEHHPMTKENLQNINNSNANFVDNDDSNVSETSSVARRKHNPPKRHHKPKKDGNVGNNKINRKKKGHKVKNANNVGKGNKNKGKNNKLKNKNKLKKGKNKNNNNNNIVINGKSGISNGVSHTNNNNRESDDNEHEGDSESDVGSTENNDENDTSGNDEDYDSNEDENSSEYQETPKPYMNGAKNGHTDDVSDDNANDDTTHTAGGTADNDDGVSINATENDHDRENDNDNDDSDVETDSGDDNSSSSSSSSSGRSSDDEYEMEYEKMAKIMADIVSRDPPKKLYWKPLSMWIRYNEEIDYHAEWALAPMPRRIAGSCHELLVAYFRSSKGEFLTRLIKLARDPDEDNKHHFETERKVSQYLTKMAKIINKCFHTRNDVCIWPVETIYFEYEDEMKWATVQAPFLPKDNYVFVKIEPNYGKPCVNDPIVGRYQHVFAAISKGLDLVRDWQGYGVSQNAFLKQCGITNVTEAIEQIVERKSGNNKKTQVLVMIDPVLTTCGAHYETNNPTDFGMKAIDEWLETHDCDKCRCDYFYLKKELRFGICDPDQEWFDFEKAPKYLEYLVKECRKELNIWDGDDDGWQPPVIETKEDDNDGENIGNSHNNNNNNASLLNGSNSNGAMTGNGHSNNNDSVIVNGGGIHGNDKK